MAVARVLDVAEYVLRRQGSMSAMKLQKLVYYCQAWSLVWDDRPMFDEDIEAWVNGPVVPVLYDAHRGQFAVQTVGGDPEHLDEDARQTVDVVLQFYGRHDAQWLSDLTHAEEPWKSARAGLPPDARSGRTIPLASMAEYYSSLAPGGG